MDWQDKKILIAEDEEYNFFYLSEVLSETKVFIIHAKNGKEAVDIMKNSEIDVILMDIRMPQLNGIDATREIRTFNKEVPIIAHTAYAFTEDRNKCLNAGCNHYLPKPVKKDDLFKILHTFLNHS
ncbi:MAG: response regulator [Bacteroidota bacterium]